MTQVYAQGRLYKTHFPINSVFLAGKSVWDNGRSRPEVLGLEPLVFGLSFPPKRRFDARWDDLEFVGYGVLSVGRSDYLDY